MKYINQIFVCAKIFKNAIPAPEFPKSEIGLMTWAEYLQFRNPSQKFHPESAYDFSLSDLNKEYGNTWRMGPEGNSYHPSYDDSKKFFIEQFSFGYLVSNQGKIVALIRNGTVYYEDPKIKKDIPVRYIPADNGSVNIGEEHDFGVTSFEQVEDLSKIINSVSNPGKRNAAEYPIILQRINVHGEPMIVRAEKQPKLNSGTTIVIMNAEGFIVAQAQNEWGATLLTVAKEYRGKGLGKIIGQFWYELNPSFKSGGFTASGQENALALWRDRVREFISKGWYSDLIRKGNISMDRIKTIIEGLKTLETK